MQDAWRVWGLVLWAVKQLSTEDLGDVDLQLAGLPLAALRFVPAEEGAPSVVPMFEGVSGRAALAEAVEIVKRWEFSNAEDLGFFLDLVDVRDAVGA
ncbi:hypothetical protein [Arachnia propionica]|uniref:Uncharacterized protein n=1 Tax=Arachnia propionica TaxID=1750 RepID=A0A3P1WYP1_9ACTN|nr:hypothetical protein [Arachnia propionica]RRD50530.1 hypothetical protein EII35_03775 [Arachnia propionica]